MAFEFESVRNLLRCPQSRSELVLHDNSLVSTDPATRRQYPILDNIPRLIVDESIVLSPDEWSRIMEQHQRNPESGSPSMN